MKDVRTVAASLIGRCPSMWLSLLALFLKERKGAHPSSADWISRPSLVGQACVEWVSGEWVFENCAKMVLAEICESIFPYCISTCWVTRCVYSNVALTFSYLGVCIGPICV